MTLICSIYTSVKFWLKHSIIKTMFDCVLHAMYISFSTIHYMFVEFAFMTLFILFNVMNNSDFMSISTCKQSFIFSSDKISVTYET